MVAGELMGPAERSLLFQNIAMAVVFLALLLLLPATAKSDVFQNLAHEVTQSWDRGKRCLEAAQSVTVKARANGLQAEIWILEPRDSMAKRREARRLVVPVDRVKHAVAVVYDGKAWRVYDKAGTVGAWKTLKHAPRPDHHRDWELDGSGAFSVLSVIGKVIP